MHKFFVLLVVCWIGCPALLWAQSAGQKSVPLEENDLRVLRGLKRVAIVVTCDEVFQSDLGFPDSEALRDRIAARLTEAGIGAIPYEQSFRGPVLVVVIGGRRAKIIIGDTLIGTVYLYLPLMVREHLGFVGGN